MLNQQELVSNYKPPQRQPGVLFQPDVYRQLQCGINQVVNAIRPTLGPNPRLTAIERHSSAIAPELLDDGGTIARRIIELENQHQNVGAMLIRGMLWRLQEQVGDGTATAATLMQTIFNEGLRYIASGGNAMGLREHLEAGLKLLINHLESKTIPVEDNQTLKQIARTVCDDEDLANSLGDIFEIVGEFGLLDIQSGNSRQPQQAYFEGNYWTGGLHTATATIRNQPVEFIDASILLTDFILNEPEQVVPILRVALQSGMEHLVIMARDVSDKVVGLLKRSQESSRMRVVAVKTPGKTPLAQANALFDMALLTGGQVLIEAAGDSTESITAEHFGKARRIWMDKNYIGIKGGKGDISALRQHIDELKRGYANTTKADTQEILHERIGRLSGGFAILYVGGTTQTEIETRKEIASRAASIIRRTKREGMLPGGGLAFLSCRDLLEGKIRNSQSTDERAAYRILHTAMMSPFCTLATNAGYEGGAILSEIQHAGEGYGFDFRSREVVNMKEAGIYDSASAQLTALKYAVKTAALALTLDAVIYRKTPEMSMLPE